MLIQMHKTEKFLCSNPILFTEDEQLLEIVAIVAMPLLSIIFAPESDFTSFLSSGFPSLVFTSNWTGDLLSVF